MTGKGEALLACALRIVGLLQYTLELPCSVSGGISNLCTQVSYDIL